MSYLVNRFTPPLVGSNASSSAPKASRPTVAEQRSGQFTRGSFGYILKHAEETVTNESQRKLLLRIVKRIHSNTQGFIVDMSEHTITGVNANNIKITVPIDSKNPLESLRLFIRHALRPRLSNVKKKPTATDGRVSLGYCIDYLNYLLNPLNPSDLVKTAFSVEKRRPLATGKKLSTDLKSPSSPWKHLPKWFNDEIQPLWEDAMTTDSLKKKSKT